MNVVVFVIATGTLLNFPFDPSVMLDCYEQGYAILDKIAMYNDSRPTDQGWYLTNTQYPVHVAGWYCK